MIIPRWEWRGFGERLAAAERALAARESERIEDSDEIYLLSRRSDASVKLRDGGVDVKQRLQVDPDGLELWTPVLKAAFPLPAEQVVTVLSVSAVPLPELARAEYTREQLAEEVLAPDPDLLALRVHKSRAHYVFAGCRAERTE